METFCYSQGMDDDIHKKIDTFFKKYPKRTYPKGQIVIFGGESPENIFYIVSGKISQYDISYRGDEIVINLFKPPAFFPMSWAINKTPNRYFFKAEEASEVYIAPPDDVIVFLKENQTVMFNLLSRLYNGIDGVLARTVHLMSGSARSRVMYELFIEANRFGRKLSDNSYELKISESDLGTHAGLTRETISREIKQLKENGIVQHEDHHIIIKDMATLKKQLGEVA
jgi:CRP-like cAMP-binding protein